MPKGAGFETGIRSSADLARVHRNLGRMADGKQLRKDFVKGVRAEVRPVAVQLRAAYRGNPSKNQPNPRGRTDLRRLLARAVTVQVRTGSNPSVVLKVDGRKMPDKMGGVPGMYEGRRRWRHPVHGNTEKWVTQDPEPTFDRITRAAAPAVRRRVSKVAEGVARDVTKG
jgi:hypothetical protein